MELLRKTKILFIIVIVWVLFASPYLFSGKTPYPSDYQASFFPPWAQYPELAGPVKNNAQPDIVGQIYPWRHFAIEELKAGQIPFWNPYSFAGTPHLANYQSAVLFPLNILFFLPIKFIDVWGFLVVAQPLFAGIFMYGLMRRMKVSSFGSILSSLSFMFCGFIVTWMGYATLGYAILPLPLALFAIESFVSKQKRKYLFLLSFSVAFSFFSGHFQTSIYFALAVFSFLLFHISVSKSKKLYVISLLFYLGGILLAMPQILPSMEFYMHTVRSVLFQKMEAIPWAYLPTLIAPDYYGNPVTRNDWFGHYAEWNGYAGAIGLSMLFFVVFLRKNIKVVYFSILGVLALLLAYDTPLVSLLVALKIPVLSTSSASRIIVLFSFSLAVLAGFSADYFIELLTKRKRIIFVWAGITMSVLIILGVAAFGNVLPIDKALVAKKNLILPFGILTLLSLLALLAWSIKFKKSMQIVMGVIVLLSIGEMYRFAHKWQSFSSKELVYKSVPVTSFYKKINNFDRAIGLSGGEDSVYYNVSVLSGYDPLYKAEYGKFIQYVASGEQKEGFRSVVNFPLKGKYTPETINFLGAKYIVHKFSDGNFAWAFPFEAYPPEQFTKLYDDGSYRVFENNTSFPRAFTVSDVRIVKDNEKLLQLMFENNLKNMAFVQEDVGVTSHASTGSAQIVEYESSRVRIKTMTSQSELLVLTDNFYPGWKATVNGKSAKIVKTDYSFRGVVVPAGESEVVFSYIPKSFIWGLVLALFGLLGIVLVAGIIRKKHEK